VTLRFDHAVIATRDLPAAVETYREVGFAVEPGGRDVGKGTRTALVRFPTDHLELVGVDDRDEALRGGRPDAALVHYLDGHRAGLSTFALRTGTPHDFDELVERWRTAGIELLDPAPTERISEDGTALRWRTAVPHGSSVREPWPFVIAPRRSGERGAAASESLRHDNGAMHIAELAVIGADLRLFELYDDLRLDAMGRADDPELDAVRAVVRLPGCEIDLLVPNPGGPLARRRRHEGPGPMQIGVLVEDLDATARLLARRGIPTTSAWPAGLRLAHPDPVVAPLVFLPRTWAPSDAGPAFGGMA
jgi:hypothetical protein